MSNQRKIKPMVSLSSMIGTVVPIEEVITSPRKNDIILGRGNGVATWNGNILFRNIIWERRDEYRSACRYEKAFIAQQVLQTITSLDPPGRFIEKTKSDNHHRHYSIVPYAVAFEKTCQALREKKNINPPKIDCRFEFGINNTKVDQSNVLIASSLEKASHRSNEDGTKASNDSNKDGTGTTVAATSRDHHKRRASSRPPKSKRYRHTEGIFDEHPNKTTSTRLNQRNKNRGSSGAENNEMTMESSSSLTRVSSSIVKLITLMDNNNLGAQRDEDETTLLHNNNQKVSCIQRNCRNISRSCTISSAFTTNIKSSSCLKPVISKENKLLNHNLTFDSSFPKGTTKTRQFLSCVTSKNQYQHKSDEQAKNHPGNNFIPIHADDDDNPPPPPNELVVPTQESEIPIKTIVHNGMNANQWDVTDMLLSMNPTPMASSCFKLNPIRTEHSPTFYSNHHESYTSDMKELSLNRIKTPLCKTPISYNIDHEHHHHDEAMMTMSSIRSQNTDITWLTPLILNDQDFSFNHHDSDKSLMSTDDTPILPMTLFPDCTPPTNVKIQLPYINDDIHEEDYNNLPVFKHNITSSRNNNNNNLSGFTLKPKFISTTTYSLMKEVATSTTISANSNNNCHLNNVDNTNNSNSNKTMNMDNGSSPKSIFDIFAFPEQNYYHQHHDHSPLHFSSSYYGVDAAVANASHKNNDNDMNISTGDLDHKIQWM